MSFRSMDRRREEYCTIAIHSRIIYWNAVAQWTGIRIFSAPLRQSQ